MLVPPFFRTTFDDRFILRRRIAQHHKIFIPILYNLPLKIQDLLRGILFI